MYTEILVPLDGSRVSEQILPYARLFASALDLPMELLRIVDPETLNDEKADTACAESLRYLETIARSFTPQPAVRCTVETGEPAESIAAVAAERQKPLITMSTHGHTGVRRWWLGSVTEKTVRSTAHPLLLIRAHRKRLREDSVEPRTVLVPLDGSPVAEQVLPHVSLLARTFQLDVVLLRAYQVEVRGHSHRMRQIRKTVRDAAQTYLDEKARILKAEGLDGVSCRVEHGNATETIVRVARELADNLVAMTTHGRSGVQRWVLGTVTSRIVRHAHDPVLVIPATSD